MQDVEKIARGLTAARKSALKAMLPGKGFMTAREIGASAQALNGLMDATRKGIEPATTLVERGYVDWPRLAYAYRLTPLGLAVRNHLMGAEK